MARDDEVVIDCPIPKDEIPCSRIASVRILLSFM